MDAISIMSRDRREDPRSQTFSAMIAGRLRANVNAGIAVQIDEVQPDVLRRRILRVADLGNA